MGEHGDIDGTKSPVRLQSPNFDATLSRAPPPGSRSTPNVDIVKVKELLGQAHIAPSRVEPYLATVSRR